MGNILNGDTLSTIDGITEFNTLFSPAADKPKGQMWQLWHDLQLFAAWGNKLPNSEEQLKLELKITEPAGFSFFPLMLEGYKEINGSCGNFISETFPAVVALGNSVNAFAKDSSDESELGIFSNIISMMQEKKFGDAFVLLKDLQAQAQKNSANAGEIIKKLSQFKAKLQTAEGKLGIVKEQILTDEATSDATLHYLAGEDGKKGELEKLSEELAADKKEYHHDVVVATTTPTYGWIPGFGFFAAVIVAAIFGDKASHMLAEIERLTTDLQNKTKELNTALAVRAVQGTADKGVTQALKETDRAISALTSLQNGWTKISGGLDTVYQSALKMSGEDQLRSVGIVKVYAGIAQQAWSQLCGPLNALLVDPYIKIAPENNSIGDLKREVDAVLDAQKKAA
ncbi:hypothetical protein PO883_27055 [Massilia sp. DJPM01]|uniref:hypothetical protein n=1 Tax=Massilia sp. DJPM01 TaxID=3024404 RepID=UPI00259DBD45|nr:hypothetical protein [Massilia sp. DJPM01]MDM5180846.1 hypothetical protein [Massilia sp. DJPM01]